MKRNFLFLYKYLKPYKFSFIVGAFLAGVSVILNALPIKVMEHFIDLLNKGEVTKEVIYKTVGMVFLLTLLYAILLFFQRKIVTSKSRVIEYDIRKVLLNYILKRSAEFYMKNKTGEIMSRLTNDLSQVRDMLGAGILHLLRTALSIIVIIIFMLNINVKYTLLALLPVVILPFFSTYILKHVGFAYKTIQERIANINVVVQETFAGISVVKSYNRESWRQEKFIESTDEYFKANMKLAKLMGVLWPLFALFGSLATVSLLYFGGKGVINGELSIGSLVALNFFLIMLAWPLVGIGWVMNLFQKGNVSAGRLFDFLQQKDLEIIGGTTKFKNGNISISNLNYKYPLALEHSLKNININIKEGSLVALVGTVGSGKSSLVSLLARICDSKQKGTIKIAGTDIEDFSVSDYRDKIAVVPQETILFSNTIKNNITFEKDIEDDVFQQALNISKIDSDIDGFSEGVEQELGERGINLSGGQRQRVAISRAVLRNPEIIILDDCLSAVDALTEAQILKEFETFFKGRTVIIISHRVSVIKNADHIYVMDEGAIVENGKHEELIKNDLLYSKLYKNQKIEEGLK